MEDRDNSAGAKTNATQSKRILVVDDDPELCQFLGTLIARRTSHQADTVSSPKDALTKVRQTHYDLVIVDVQMPSMDGMALLAQIRNILPDIEGIVLTGHASLKNAQEAIAQRVYEYLEKPVAPDQMLRSIGNALARQEIASQLAVTSDKVSALNKQLRKEARDRVSRVIPFQRAGAALVIFRMLRGAILPRLENLRQQMHEVRDAVADHETLSASVSTKLWTIDTELNRLVEHFSETRKLIHEYAVAPTRADVVPFLREYFSAYLDIFPQLRIETSFPQEVVDVPFDRAALASALDNILENALATTGQSGTITVRMEFDSAWVRLEVVDSGRGFSDESLARATNPLRPSRLGLALARQIVEEHKGTLDLKNQPSGGGIVKLALPRG